MAQPWRMAALGDRIMTTIAFQSGAVVRLKSGGPKMTVVDVQTQEVTCTWFTKQDLKEQGTFPPYALEDAND